MDEYRQKERHNNVMITLSRNNDMIALSRNDEDIGKPGVTFTKIADIYD